MESKGVGGKVDECCFDPQFAGQRGNTVGGHTCQNGNRED